MRTAESLSTLKFANRAKSIKNAARLNEDVDQRTLLRKYERELRRLRAELLDRQASLVDSRRLLAVRTFVLPLSLTPGACWCTDICTAPLYRSHTSRVAFQKIDMMTLLSSARILVAL